MTTKKKSPSSTTKEVVEQKPDVYVSDKDKISNLESAMAKLAQTLEQSIERIETRVQGINKMPTSISPEARVEAMKMSLTNELGQSMRVKDLLHPRAQDSGFQPKDVVRLSDDCAKAAHYKANNDGFPAIDGEDWEPALGVVMNYMYTKRNGQRKYKVNFPNFGKDGFTEKELVLVKGV